MVTFAMSVPGHLPATPDAYERNALVWIDTDKNGSTGDPEDGTEYALIAWNDPSGRWWNVGRWNGADWESVPQSSTMSFARQGDTLSWTLSTADLGGATSFRFYVLAGTWDSTAERWLARDDAPDTGWWTYDIASSPPAPKPPTTTVSLGIEAPTTTPRSRCRRETAHRPLSRRVLPKEDDHRHRPGDWRDA
jgi:hypothetical protein